MWRDHDVGKVLTQLIQPRAFLPAILTEDDFESASLPALALLKEVLPVGHYIRMCDERGIGHAEPLT